MKTFLNVLYRRILYKIPLKLLLVLLAITAVFIACFSSADYVFNRWSNTSAGYTANYTTDTDITCLFADKAGATYTIEGVTYNMPQRPFSTPLECYEGNGQFTIKAGANGTYMYIFGYDKTTMSSLQCQTEYNLIPIESVDQNYCESNNLCPSCPVCPSVPVGTGGYSELYINNILHLGAPNIIINISEEIDWDYAYTAGGQNMNIDVFGYNVDYEKVQSVIDLQNYKPTDDDFSEIISVLAPYSKIIIFFVVLFGLWAMIKKPFKSKKL